MGIYHARKKVNNLVANNETAADLPPLMVLKFVVISVRVIQSNGIQIFVHGGQVEGRRRGANDGADPSSNLICSSMESSTTTRLAILTVDTMNQCGMVTEATTEVPWQYDG